MSIKHLAQERYCQARVRTRGPPVEKSEVLPTQPPQLLMRQFLQNWVRRGYLMAVTGSMWLLQGLCGCYRVNVLLFFANIALRGSSGTDLREGVSVAIKAIGIVLVDLNEFPSIFQTVQHSHSRHQETTSNLLRINLKGILTFNRYCH